MNNDTIFYMVCMAVWVSVPWCIAVICVLIHAHYRR